MDFNKKRSRYFDAAVFFIIFIIAFSIRLYKIDTTLYDVDIVNQFGFSESIAKGDFYLGGQVPVYGALRTQQSFGPFGFYLLAVPMLFTKNYLVYAGWIAFLGSLAVGILYITGLKFFNRTVGLIAALFYATSPWAVFYSRFVWNPNYMWLLQSLFLFFLLGFISKKDKISYSYLAGLGIVGGLMMQPYPTGYQICFIGFIALVLLKKINLRVIAFGAILVLITLAPFIANSFLIGSNPLTETKNVLIYPQITAPKGDTLTNMHDTFGIAVMYSTNHFGKYQFGSTQPFSLSGNAYYLGLAAFLSVFMLLSLLYVARNSLKNGKFLVMLLWFAIPVILMIIRNKNVAPHYMGALFPIQFLIMAVFSYKLIKSMPKYSKLIYVILAAIFISQIAFSVQTYNFLEKYGRTDANYDSTYREVYDVADYIIRNSDGRPYVFLINGSKSFDPYKKMFEFRGIEPNYIYIPRDSIYDMQDKSGYFILDRFSNDYSCKFNAEEKAFFDKQNIAKIMRIEIVKFGNRS